MTNVYRPILDNRRIDNELFEARRILRAFADKFESGNNEEVRSRHINSLDVDVLDVKAFFERWPNPGHGYIPAHLPAGVQA